MEVKGPEGIDHTRPGMDLITSAGSQWEVFVESLASEQDRVDNLNALEAFLAGVQDILQRKPQRRLISIVEAATIKLESKVNEDKEEEDPSLAVNFGTTVTEPRSSAVLQPHARVLAIMSLFLEERSGCRIRRLDRRVSAKSLRKRKIQRPLLALQASAAIYRRTTTATRRKGRASP